MQEEFNHPPGYGEPVSQITDTLPTQLQPVTAPLPPKEFSFLGKALILSGACLFLTFTIIGGLWFRDYKIEARKEAAALVAAAKLKEDKALIRDMITFCNFAKLDDEEQKKVDSGGDDPAQVEFILRGILTDRIRFWDNRVTELVADGNKLLEIRKNATFWDANVQELWKSKIVPIGKEVERGQDQKNKWLDTRKRFLNKEYVKTQKPATGKMAL